MIKTNKKNKIMALLLTFAMVFSMGTTVMATNADAAEPVKLISPKPQKYTINLAAVTDQQMRDSQVSIRFELDGREPVTITGDDYMGYPVLMNVPSLGGVTLIPIRLICEAIGVPVDWVSATETDAAHALITSPDHGDVKLYMGATSIEASDGTTYQETTYTFPDGSNIPLCLYRNGRTYVPVRFITSFLVKNATFSWSQNMQTLTIKGGMTAMNSAWDGKGVNCNVEIPLDNPTANMPNVQLIEKQLGQTAGTTTGASVALAAVGIDKMDGAIAIRGFDYSANEPHRFNITVAAVKDLLDAESANAFLAWLNEADRLNAIYQKAPIDSDEEAEALKACVNHKKNFKEKGTVQFGNVNVTPLDGYTGFIFENIE